MLVHVSLCIGKVKNKEMKPSEVEGKLDSFAKSEAESASEYYGLLDYGLTEYRLRMLP